MSSSVQSRPKTSSVLGWSLFLAGAIALLWSLLAVHFGSAAAEAATATKPPSVVRSMFSGLVRHTNDTAPVPSAPHREQELSSNIVMLAEVVEKLHEFAKKPAVRVPLNRKLGESTKQVVRAWVSRVMDLDTAERRQSTRFTRASYMTETKEQRPLYLDDRMGEDGAFRGRGDARATTSDEATKVVYREGNDGEYFKFQKFKENGRPTDSGMDQTVALDKAKQFFVDNKMIFESNRDQVKPDEVRQRMTNAPNGTVDNRTEFLEQQDIVLRRTYDGKPVINSLATVGVLPGSSEIVGVKLSNWIGLDSAATVTTKPASSDSEARATVSQIQGNLVHELLAASDGQLNGATVTDVHEGWFQTTKEGLVPVLVFNVDLKETATGESRPDVVAINPYGKNEIIWQQGRIAKSPAISPDDPQ